MSAKAPPFTEADDFFLKAHAHAWETAELAKATGKTAKRVVRRLSDLGLTPEVLAEARKEAARMKGLKGYAVGTDRKPGDPNTGVVSMTGGRSFQDDEAAKLQGGEEYMKRFEKNIYRG